MTPVEVCQILWFKRSLALVVEKKQNEKKHQTHSVKQLYNTGRSCARTRITPIKMVNRRLIHLAFFFLLTITFACSNCLLTSDSSSSSVSSTFSASFADDPFPSPNRKLVQVIVLSRHCDRAPAHSDTGVPNDPLDWRLEIGVRAGELTGLGHSQCYQLGKILRERYLNVHSPFFIHSLSLSPHSKAAVQDVPMELHHCHRNGTSTIVRYDAKHFQFHASDVDRTILSMNSIVQGLFPEGTGPMNDLTHQFALPHGMTLVPVHAIPNEQDIYLRAIHNCQWIDTRLRLLPRTKVWHSLNRHWLPFIHELNGPTGWNLTDIDEFHGAYDIMNCQQSHNRLHVPFALENWSRIFELASEIQYLRHSRELEDNLGGGPFVEQIRNHMHRMVEYYASQRDERLTAGATESEEPAVPPPLSYVHYSAHDTTIQAILAALNMSSQHKALREGPGYGAQIIWELWRQEGETEATTKKKTVHGWQMREQEYFVSFIYRNRYDAAAFTSFQMPKYCHSRAVPHQNNRDHPSHIDHYNHYCPWHHFVRYVNEVSVVPLDQWCQRCNSSLTVPSCALLLAQQSRQRHNWRTVPSKS